MVRLLCLHGKGGQPKSTWDMVDSGDMPTVDDWVHYIVSDVSRLSRWPFVRLDALRPILR